MSTAIDQVLDLIGNMTVLELSELKTKFGQVHAQPFGEIQRHEIGVERLVLGRDVANPNLSVKRANRDQRHAQRDDNVIIIKMLRLAPDRSLPNRDAFFTRRQTVQTCRAKAAAEQIIEVEPPGQIKLGGSECRQFPVD